MTCPFIKIVWLLGLHLYGSSLYDLFSIVTRPEEQYMVIGLYAHLSTRFLFRSIGQQDNILTPESGQPKFSKPSSCLVVLH